jgi:hypothetical protein
MNEMPRFRLLENAPLGPAPMRPQFRLGEPLHPLQIEGFRKMTAAQKFRQLEEMYQWGVGVKKSQLAKEFPSWSEETLEREARRAYMYAPD